MISFLKGPDMLLTAMDIFYVTRNRHSEVKNEETRISFENDRCNNNCFAHVVQGFKEEPENELSLIYVLVFA